MSITNYLICLYCLGECHIAKTYENEREQEIKKYSNIICSDVFSESDIIHLPEPVQTYFRVW